jgi:type II secretory ATPase GspE/PulE/Tfp pilus assembly ATPase PilB-like protein
MTPRAQARLDTVGTNGVLQITFRRESNVRFRIDGVMHDVLTLPRNVHDPLVTRFKNLADLDVANRRAIQMGRMIVQHRGDEYDLRETVLPAVLGEKITVRIWGEEHVRVQLDQLGFSKSDGAHLERCLRAPGGLIVFSGPVGCGKTTVMHAAMLHLASPEKTLYSIEDPVEISLPGVIQMSVNKKAGVSFADALRGFMRSDPDIVMVGEVPDEETVKQAVQLAITGHLVMTQLHANDAASAVERLIRIGADPFLLSESLLMISSQRLIRRICTECKEPADTAPEVITELVRRAMESGMPWPGGTPTFYNGKGCDRCLHTGYYRRTGIYEIMIIEGRLRELIRTGAERSGIREVAIKQGMTTMFADGMAKAIAGETTPEEVLRVLGG